MSEIKVKLLGDRVIIRQTEADKVIVQGELILDKPESYQHKPAEGQVVAVGPGIINDRSILVLILKVLIWLGNKWLVKAVGTFNAEVTVPNTVPSEFHPSPSMTVKPGDYVKFGRYAGTEIQIDGEKYMMVREVDIFYVE